MKRAAVSVASNIAEGQGRQHPKEFRHFLSVANGSLAELDTQLVIAESLHFISPESGSKLNAQLTEIRRMLYVLAARIGADDPKPGTEN
jgi:four helix bundle protein